MFFFWGWGGERKVGRKEGGEGKGGEVKGRGWGGDRVGPNWKPHFDLSVGTPAV
jgi:hypothetical protein